MRAPEAGRPVVARVEIDLRAPVAAWLERHLGPAVLADELDFGWAVPDLVAGVPVDFAERVATDTPPIIDAAQVAALADLLRPAGAATLRAATSAPWGRYCERVLDPLARLGLIASDEGTWETVRVPLDVFPRLVAIELKMHDWKRAVAQAARYRAFAHAAYIAMPAVRLTRAALDLAEVRGVGVLSISRGHACCLLQADDHAPLDRRVRTLASELMLASLLGLRGSLPAGSPRGQRGATTMVAC